MGDEFLLGAASSGVIIMRGALHWYILFYVVYYFEVLAYFSRGSEAVYEIYAEVSGVEVYHALVVVAGEAEGACYKQEAYGPFRCVVAG